MLRRNALKFLGASLIFGSLTGPALSQPTSAKDALHAKLPVTLYYSLPAASGQVLEGFVQEFQQTHTYLDLQVRNFPSSAALYKELSTPGNPLPTMAVVENSWLPGLVSAQPDLYPVETWMPKEQFGFSWAIKNNAYTPLWDASHVSGTLYALPMWFTTKALIYNTEVFDRAKIKQVPVTWEQVLAVAKKLSDPKATDKNLSLSLGQPDNPSAIARNLQMMVWQSGGEGLAASIAGAEISAATSPAMQNVIDYLKKLNTGLGPVDGEAALIPVGMTIGNVEDYLKLRAAGLPVKTAVIPGFDKTQRITETQGWALVMFKNAPERELYKVQEFAFYLLDFQQQRRWAEATPFLAAHLKVFDNPFYRQARSVDHNNLRVFLNSVGKSKIVDTSGNRPERYVAIGKMLGPVLRGEKPLTDLLPAP